MTDEEFEAICKFVSERLISLYIELANSFPKDAIITGFSASLATCAIEANIPRETILEIISGFFDDIETGDQ